MIVTSAPGKVILFGEHAVVYDEPSLAGAIDRRVYIQVERRVDRQIKIFSDDLSPKEISFSLDKPCFMEKNDAFAEFRYVKKAVELTFEHLKKDSGLELKIDSEIPPASGLGSSASVSVATILAVSTILDIELKKEEIARLGHRVELEVQGAASPTDALTTTFGGILYIQPRKQKHEPINVSLPLVVGYTGVERSTKILVENVRLLKERYPMIIDPIIRDIGRIVREAKTRLENNDKDIGELMNINHGLLEALGISTEKLSELVYTARTAGAAGAKLTGAGGGGCMIAYTPENAEKVIKAIKGCNCTALKAPISREGVRVEI
jgi:mevalonate kinase